MSEATFRSAAGILPLTAVAATLAGEIVQLADGRAAVAQCDLAADELGSQLVEGNFDVNAATGVTFLIGEQIFWDVSANTAINSEDTALADFCIGRATKAKLDGELVVRVDLNSHVRRDGKILEVALAATLTVADLGATVYGDTQAGAFSVTLPAAALCKGGRFTFVRAGTGTNALTLDGNLTENVDGGTTVASMDAARDTLTIECNGLAWFIVAARLA